MLYIDVQPPSECFWSGAGDGFVAVSATSTLLTAVRSTSTSSVTFPIRPQLLVFYSNNPKNESLIELRSKVRQMDRPTDWRIAARQHCLMPSSYCIGRRHNNTTSIWKMLGPFATASRFTLPFTIHQVSLLSHAACASMSTTTTTTTTTRDRAMAPWNGPNQQSEYFM